MRKHIVRRIATTLDVGVRIEEVNVKHNMPCFDLRIVGRNNDDMAFFADRLAGELQRIAAELRRTA